MATWILQALELNQWTPWRTGDPEKCKRQYSDLGDLNTFTSVSRDLFDQQQQNVLIENRAKE